jgi:hypothetical protein
MRAWMETAGSRNWHHARTLIRTCAERIRTDPAALHPRGGLVAGDVDRGPRRRAASRPPCAEDRAGPRRAPAGRPSVRIDPTRGPRAAGARTPQSRSLGRVRGPGARRGIGPRGPAAHPERARAHRARAAALDALARRHRRRPHRVGDTTEMHGRHDPTRVRPFSLSPIRDAQGPYHERADDVGQVPAERTSGMGCSELIPGDGASGKTGAAGRAGWAAYNL